MTRVRTAVLLALLAAMLVVPATAAATSPQMLMLEKVNAYRAKHGVAKVHLSRSLVRSASAYSRHMMRSGYFGHASRIHASRRYRTLGEIIEIHRGLRAGVRTAFRAWVHSPPHRSVMLMSQFRFAGAGFASGRFHGHRDTIWTMHFGRH
jgi:uncharacterized protein YkwD